jgi:L-threonylcarbamoyladenylate synthase
MTARLAVDPGRPAPGAIAEAAAVLRLGGLVAIPTETVYGLAADATNPEAVARIFAAKGRPSFNPLIVHVSDPAMARRCVAAWPGRAEQLAARFWPGPLTMVLPRSPIVPDEVTGGLGTVGVRMPAHPVARALIAAVGRPLAAPSANRSTGVSPTLARHVLKDLDGRIDLVLDAGPTPLGLESTVADLTVEPPRVLRPGAITAEQLGATTLDVHAPARPASPGLLAVHYAPRTPAVRVEPEALAELTWPAAATLIVLGTPDLPPIPAQVRRHDLPEPEAAARNFYRLLHESDEAGVDLLVLVPPPDRPVWRAIRDRLRRATRPWPHP